MRKTEWAASLASSRMEFDRWSKILLQGAFENDHAFCKALCSRARELKIKNADKMEEFVERRWKVWPSDKSHFGSWTVLTLSSNVGNVLHSVL